MSLFTTLTNSLVIRDASIHPLFLCNSSHGEEMLMHSIAKCESELHWREVYSSTEIFCQLFLLPLMEVGYKEKIDKNLSQ